MARPRLLLARPADRIAAAAAEAEALGFAALPAPLLEVRPAPGGAADAALDGVRDRAFAWVVFTSATGVRHAWARAGARGLDLAAALQGARVAAIGRPTAAALAARGVAAEVPARHDSAGLAAHLAPRGVAGRDVLVLRSDRGSPELPAGLAAAGARVRDVAVYALAMPEDTAPAAAALRDAAAQGLDAAAFTSGLAVRHLALLARDLGVEAPLRAALAAARVGALGEPTARALAAEGLPCHVVAEEARFDVLLRRLRAALPQVMP